MNKRASTIFAFLVGMNVPFFVEGIVLVSCNATPAQTVQTFTDGLKTGSCVIGLVLSGVTDISQLLQCSGATEQLVIDIINDFENRNPDAASAQITLLEQAKNNAKFSLAKKTVK